MPSTATALAADDGYESVLLLTLLLLPVSMATPQAKSCPTSLPPYGWWSSERVVLLLAWPYMVSSTEGVLLDSISYVCCLVAGICKLCTWLSITMLTVLPFQPLHASLPYCPVLQVSPSVSPFPPLLLCVLSVMPIGYNVVR